VVEQVGVAFYLNFSVLIIGETIVAMNGDFHLKANSFEFFIEIFVGTDSISFLSRIGGQIKFFASGSTVPPVIKEILRGTVAQRIACLFFASHRK
jgi:hypothetical protein